MNKRSVLIISTEDDLHAEAVTRILESSDVPVYRISNRHFPGSIGLAMNHGRECSSIITLPNKKKLRDNEIGSIWWRRPTDYGVDNKFNTYSDRQFARLNCLHAFEAFITALPCRCMNDIWNQRKAQRKGFQLQVAKECGLRVPDTLITNQPQLASSFFAKNSRSVFKSLEKTSKAAAETCLFTQDDLLRLHTLCYAPAIFQEYIEPGCDLRITIVENDIYAARLSTENEYGKIDIRLDMGAKIESFELPEDLRRSLLLLMRRLGLAFGAVDMKMDREGNFFFLEVNPAGQWIYIEIETGQPITRAVADWLATGISI